MELFIEKRTELIEKYLKVIVHKGLFKFKFNVKTHTSARANIIESVIIDVSSAGSFEALTKEEKVVIINQVKEYCKKFI